MLSVHQWTHICLEQTPSTDRGQRISISSMLSIFIVWKETEDKF